MSMNIMLLGASGGGGAWGPDMGGSPTVHTWGSYESFAFRTVGTHQVYIPGDRTVDICVIGGGGAGGGRHGGGGGGGGIWWITNHAMAAGTYNFTIGQGGQKLARGCETSNQAPSGDDSSITGNGYTITTKGGGVGGLYNGVNAPNGFANGGAAGGNSNYANGTQSGSTSNKGGTWYGGHRGGNSTTWVEGGGGAGGGNGYDYSGNTGGQGGTGQQLNLTGSNYYWAGGGGGGAYNQVPGYGGVGGGGAGYCSPGSSFWNQSRAGGGQALNSGGNGQSNTAGDGGANTGAGGGGGGESWSCESDWTVQGGGRSGSGGSGIIVIRTHVQ